MKVIATYADLSKAPMHWYLLGAAVMAAFLMVCAVALSIFSNEHSATLMVQVCLVIYLISLYTRRGLRNLNDELEKSRAVQAEQDRRIRELEQAISELKATELVSAH